MALRRTEGRTAFELQCRHSFSRLAQIPELGQLQFGMGDLTSKVAAERNNAGIKCKLEQMNPTGSRWLSSWCIGHLLYNDVFMHGIFDLLHLLLFLCMYKAPLIGGPKVS